MPSGLRMPLAALTILLAGPPAVGRDLPLAAFGPSRGRGMLVNETVGAGKFAAVDPSRPTVVLVHGLNPFHPWVHFNYGGAYARTVASRTIFGPNVLAWDWNAATLPGFRLNTLDRNAMTQGLALAEALRRAGVDPGRLHLVGHSHGGIVAATAARVLSDGTGRPVARLTLLDPIRAHHPILFGQLRATTAAARVDHLWADGHSGFGGEARYPGVANRRLPPRLGVLGFFRPLHVDHLNAMRTFVAEAG